MRQGRHNSPVFLHGLSGEQRPHADKGNTWLVIGVEIWNNETVILAFLLQIIFALKTHGPHTHVKGFLCQRIHDSTTVDKEHELQ